MSVRWRFSLTIGISTALAGLFAAFLVCYLLNELEGKDEE